MNREYRATAHIVDILEAAQRIANDELERDAEVMHARFHLVEAIERYRNIQHCKADEQAAARMVA